MKKVRATKWKVTSDDTGNLIDIEFVCPHCQNATGDFFFCRGYVSEAFETVRDCPICGKEVTIVCEESQTVSC